MDQHVEAIRALRPTDADGAELHFRAAVDLVGVELAGYPSSAGDAVYLAEQARRMAPIRAAYATPNVVEVAREAAITLALGPPPRGAA